MATRGELRSEGDTDLAVGRQREVRPRGQEEGADVGADEEHSEGNEPDDARLEIEIVRDVAGAGIAIPSFTAAMGGFSAPEFPTEDKGAGKDAEYTIAASQWVPQARWPGSAEFDERFVAKYGSHPS
jgi:hypothetical protein